VLLGFGGVSEYGITVRWDKNFLTVVYLTLARRACSASTAACASAAPHARRRVEARLRPRRDRGGRRRPTLIDMKNNLARGIRKASDFLMALQLTGAYKRSLANLQVRLPAS
jgi:hypothetical protein